MLPGATMHCASSVCSYYVPVRLESIPNYVQPPNPLPGRCRTGCAPREFRRLSIWRFCFRALYGGGPSRAAFGRRLGRSMPPEPEKTELMLKNISIRGAREHNLKNVDVEIPRDTLTVLTGLSGSGKSSLAFDTIYAEGQRRYVESLSAYARQFLELMQKPDVDHIEGLSPAISIEQMTFFFNPRSTVATVTEIYDYMRLLWARVGIPYSPASGLPIESQSVSQMVDRVLGLPEGTRFYLLAPVVRGRKGEYKKELAEYLKKGFQRVKIDGTFHELAE